MTDEPKIGDKVPVPWQREGAPAGTYIGHGHVLSRVVANDVPESWIGVHVWHECRGGEQSPGTVYFDIPELPQWMRDDGHTTWSLVSREPLHVEPSILCTVCKDHGYIRNGAWEAC